MLTLLGIITAIAIVENIFSNISRFPYPGKDSHWTSLDGIKTSLVHCMLMFFMRKVILEVSYDYFFLTSYVIVSYGIKVTKILDE